MPKIYTKTGDSGTSSLYDGNRLEKHSIFFEVLGDIDELSSNIGMLYANIKKNYGNIPCNAYPNRKYDFFIHNLIKIIQKTLQNIASEIATVDRSKRTVVELTEEPIKVLETEIDNMDIHLPKLTGFVLQGVTQTDAQAHICRSVCRRLERHLWNLHSSKECISGKKDIELENVSVNPNILKYINRLSDYFFQLARYLCIVVEKKDEIM